MARVTDPETIPTTAVAHPPRYRMSPYRLIQAASVFGRHGVGAIVDRVRGRENPMPRRLRFSFEALGPTFIKFGQLIASSPGLFPRALSDEFLACLDRMPPVPFEQVERVLAQELHERRTDFVSIDPVPLAAASMAQVHAAELKDGRHVVIKVRRPGIRRHIRRDIGNLMTIARLLERYQKDLAMANPVAIVEDFARTLQEELDLTLEARTMQAFRQMLLESFEFQVDVPEPYLEYCTPRVLVMERVEGIRADDVLSIKAAGIDAQECLIRLMRLTMRGVMFHGLFHGDLHAGNLRLGEGDRVVLMDFGLMGRLELDDRRHMTHLFVAMARRDFKAMAEAMLALEKQPPERAEAFGRDLEATLRPVMRTQVGEQNFGSILQSLVEMGGRHDLRLPRALILLLKQLLYVDRYAHLLAPGFNPFKDVRTIDFVWNDPLGRELYPQFLHYFVPSADPSSSDG